MVLSVADPLLTLSSRSQLGMAHRKSQAQRPKGTNITARPGINDMAAAAYRPRLS